MVEDTVREAKGLRNERSTREATELLNEVPEREDIWKATKEIQESAPVVDGVGV